MKILFLARAVDLSATSGDAVHVRELASGLVSNDTSLHVVSVGSVRSRAVVNPAGWLASTVGRAGASRLYPLRQVVLLLEAIRAMRDLGTELVYARPTGGLTGTFGVWVEVLVAWLADAPLVLEINGWAEDEASAQRSSRLFAFRRVGRAVSRFLLRRVQGFVAVDEVLRSRLVNELGIPAGQVTVIRNGANVRAFYPAPGDETRRQLSIPENARVLVFVGSLSLEADLRPVIESMPDLVKEFPEVCLIVVGSGADFDRYVGLANSLGVADRVRFVGSVPYERVPALINAGDLGLVATKKQLPGNPIKLYEYWACAKAVVGTRTPSLAFIEQIGGGRLADPSSRESWRRGIGDLLRDRVASLEMGRRGREFVTAYRSWEATSREVLEYVRRVRQAWSRGG